VAASAAAESLRLGEFHGCGAVDEAAAAGGAVLVRPWRLELTQEGRCQLTAAGQAGRQEEEGGRLRQVAEAEACGDCAQAGGSTQLLLC
jgi:hypothetical protein